MTRVRFNIREEPSDEGRRIKEIGKGDELRVLAWGSEWCKVQSMDGKYTGYAKNKCCSTTIPSTASVGMCLAMKPIASTAMWS